MQKLQSLYLLIGVVFFVVLIAADEDISLNRKKRQAPNINVHKIPKTSFTCSDKKIGEYYADPETSCQVYHVCIPGMHSKLSLISFVCPNGTIFNQATRVCSPFARVDCRLALKFYETIHGNLDSRRTNFEADYDNYVPPPPPKTPAPARQPPPPPRQSSRSQPQSVSRNTLPPPAPEEPPRAISRFRPGAQFRGPQSRSSQTPAPVPPARQPQPQVPSRQQVASPSSPRQPAPAIRPPLPTFRPPLIAGRGIAPVTQPPAVLPPRPTIRTVVSTSTDNYNYEYELEEYEYEDELPETGNTRSKRNVKLSSYADEYDSQSLDIDREPQKTSFSCLDKVPGGVYADMETDCEMFHICIPLGKHKMLDYKVHCANTTAFDQELGSCRSKAEFKCEKAQLFYQLDKLNSPALGKRPLYKKASYSTSKKFPQTLKV